MTLHRALCYAGAVLCAIGLAALPAFSGSLDLRGTTVTLQPSDEPGVLAEVIFHNADVNYSGDDGTYELTLDGLIVGVTFQWNADTESGADQITVIPPDGVACIPSTCTLTIPEDEAGVLILYEWFGF